MHCAHVFMYAHIIADNANPEDPNEISFAKNEILEIIDKQGKWWQAKKEDGTVGSRFPFDSCYMRQTLTFHILFMHSSCSVKLLANSVEPGRNMRSRPSLLILPTYLLCFG